LGRLSSFARKRPGRRGDQLRELALIAAAVSSVAAVLAGIFLNVSNSADNAFGQVASGLVAAVSAGLAFIASRRIAEPSHETLRLAELAAILRMQSVLSGDWRRKLWAQPVELELSVALSAGTGVEKYRETESAHALIAALVSAPRSTFLLGEAGAGKSTVLRNLAMEMLRSAHSDEYRLRPLFLNAQTWTPGVRVRDWLGVATLRAYGVEPKLTNYWLAHRSCYLLIDDVDELPPYAWQPFVNEMNDWLSSSRSGGIILACRETPYQEAFNRIRHDQVATLQALNVKLAASLLARYAGDSIGLEQLNLALALINAEGDESAVSPVVIEMLAQALSEGVDSPIAGVSSPSTAAMRLALDLERRGDVAEAKILYAALAERDPTDVGQIAAVRLSLLIAKSGDLSSAKKLLQESVARRLKDSLDEPTERDRRDDLTDDQQVVLKALDRAPALSLPQISAATNMAPGRVSVNLRTLQEQGLVEVLTSDGGGLRYRRSSVALDV
jgi:hypothetical protein